MHFTNVETNDGSFSSHPAFQVSQSPGATKEYIYPTVVHINFQVCIT